MQIRLPINSYSIIQDGNNLYFLKWYHYPPKLEFYQLDDNSFEGVQTIPFVENMELIVNPDKDYYENHYRLNKTQEGTIQVSLTAIGLLNQSLQPDYYKYKEI